MSGDASTAAVSPHNSARNAAFGKLDRILVVRLGAMGDVIHALPAATALRAAFPAAHIGWLIEERWAELLCASGSPRRGPRSPLRPLVDEIHTVKLKAWRQSLLSPSTLQAIATVWNDIGDAGYDIAIDLQGSIRSALLARFSGARVVYGATRPWESPASLWYSRKTVVEGKHVIEQNLSLVETLIERGRLEPLREIPPAQLPYDATSEQRIAESLRQHNVQDFALLNPGAGWGAKRWPAERYGEVAKALAEMNICSLVNYGPGEEDLFRIVLGASGGRALPAKGSIGELISLTRHARLFIGGDTGPLHLAAALKIPVVAIFGPTDPARNGPFGTRGIVLRSAESSTSHARLAAPEDGMLNIKAENVIAAARQLLGRV